MSRKYTTPTTSSRRQGKVLEAKIFRNRAVPSGKQYKRKSKHKGNPYD